MANSKIGYRVSPCFRNSHVTYSQKQSASSFDCPTTTTLPSVCHTKSPPVPASEPQLAGAVTHRIAAVLVDDNPVRKCLIVGLNVQSAISRIQGVFLDKINVIDSCDL